MVIMTKGKNTMNHERTPSPRLHSMLSRVAMIIVLNNFRNAVSYSTLNTSMIICTTENPTYSRAGAQYESSPIPCIV